MEKKPLKVKFQGKEYWLLEGLNESGPLAYLHQCDENGTLDWDCAFDASFAHYWPETGVMRYGEKIGTKEDLEVVR